jgi:hypothetical protein
MQPGGRTIEQTVRGEATRRELVDVSTDTLTHRATARIRRI